MNDITPCASSSVLRNWFAGTIGGLILASVAFAKPGIIHTKDGRALEGEVTERNDVVVVQIRGIETSVNRDNVESIEYPKPFDQQYAERLKKLDDKDVQGRIELARWA